MTRNNDLYAGRVQNVLAEMAVGWLDLIRVQLPLTSPLAHSSSGGERERERESLVYTFFFL